MGLDVTHSEHVTQVTVKHIVKFDMLRCVDARECEPVTPGLRVGSGVLFTEVCDYACSSRAEAATQARAEGLGNWRLLWTLAM